MFHRFSRPHGRLPCKFELNRSSTPKLRSLFPESCRNTPKNSFFFRSFLAQNVIIFPSKWSIFLLAHLLQSNWRLPWKFELNRSFTANLRSVFLEPCQKTLKNPFFQSILVQNLIFFPVKRPILFFAHLLQSNGWLP